MDDKGSAAGGPSASRASGSLYLQPACRRRGGTPMSIRSIGAKRMSAVVNAKGRGPNETRPHEVYIGSQTRNGWRKSKWANPFRLSRDGDRDFVIATYRRWLL